MAKKLKKIHYNEMTRCDKLKILAGFVSTSRSVSFFQVFLDSVTNDHTGELTETDITRQGLEVNIKIPDDFAKVFASIKYLDRCSRSNLRPDRKCIHRYSWQSVVRGAKDYHARSTKLESLSVLEINSDKTKDKKKTNPVRNMLIPIEICHLLNAYDVQTFVKSLVALPESYKSNSRDLNHKVINGFAKDIIWSIRDNNQILWEEFPIIKNYFYARILRDPDSTRIFRSLMKELLSQEEISMFVKERPEFKEIFKLDILERAMKVIFEKELEESQNDKHQLEESKAAQISYSLAYLPNATFSTLDQESSGNIFHPNCVPLISFDQELPSGPNHSISFSTNFIPNDQEAETGYSSSTHSPDLNPTKQETAGMPFFPIIMPSHGQNSECFPYYTPLLGPFNQPENADHYHQQHPFPKGDENLKFCDSFSDQQLQVYNQESPASILSRMFFTE